ncbi:MAG: 16S rRNA (cytosine(1402)-N(4))-methyltransferase RsmH [Deltaproteobacteria bacterium]|nr:16S rRNA (cytosine(1402)-N(4))-methyltransferase RsmH [Deltaproteobacteria bacterium]
MKDFGHSPVLLDEVIELLRSGEGGTFVDATLGGAGHGRAILEANENNRLIGIDRDSEAIEAAKIELQDFEDRVVIVKNNFSEIKAVIEDLGLASVDGVLMDFGVSSYQLDSLERGFGFESKARLDMRMDTDEELTAYEVVNSWSEEELIRIFRKYGEERFSKRYARAILKKREVAPIETPKELALIIKQASPAIAAKQKIHPATRIFQAIRIAVNDELENIKKGLAGAVEVLRSGGMVCAISFHSLEDKLVKGYFRELSTDCICPPKAPICCCDVRARLRLTTRKAVKAGAEEIERNPRSRSARLRAAEKI